MNVYAFEENGKCFASATFEFPQDAEDYAKQNNYAIYKLSPEHKQITDIYYDGENIIDIPPAPNAFSKFNYETKTWESFGLLVVARRNELLLQSDWTQLPDVPLETKAAWATYRQALRDITDQPGFPDNVIWPTPPQ